MGWNTVAETEIFGKDHTAPVETIRDIIRTENIKKEKLLHCPTVNRGEQTK